MDHDPDRVLQICERWLELDPTEEAIFFNKGVAHFVKRQFQLAVEAFDDAVSLAPGDLWNLIHRASCLATLERDRECLRDLLLAATQDSRKFGAYLRAVPRVSAAIPGSLRRIDYGKPSDPRARQLLREYFGLGFRLRVAMHRVRSRHFPQFL